MKRNPSQPPGARLQPEGRRAGPERPRVGKTGVEGGLEQSLARAAFRAFREAAGAAVIPPREIPLELRLSITTGRRWSVTARPSIREQIGAAVRSCASAQDIHATGRVYCFRCERSDCGHSVPPDPGRVFGGYSPTGVPRWPELIQVLLEGRHPSVELLYGPTGNEVVAAFVDAERLKHHQLDAFGRRSRAFNILGEVVLGYLKVRTESGGDAERVALTLQAVLLQPAQNAPRMFLNVLGRLGDGTPAVEALSRPGATRVLDIIGTLRRRLEALIPSLPRGRPVRLQPEDLEGRVGHLMRQTVRALERLGRQAVRRTRHAEERRSDLRPTAKAYEDARSAATGDILWDERKGTFVVLGPQKRVHVFNPQGRHITSLLLDSEEIHGRRRRRRWQPPVPELLNRFRAALGQSPAGDDGDGGP